MRCAFADRSCLLPTPRYWRATTHNPRIPAQSCYLRADSFIESLAEPRPRAERSRVNMSFLNPALRPLLSGNLPLAQAKRRCYRPNPQPLGNLANWRSGPRALITQSLYHFITLVLGLAALTLLSRRKFIGTLSKSSAQCMSTCASAPGASPHHVFIRHMITCLITCPMNPPECQFCRTALITDSHCESHVL